MRALLLGLVLVLATGCGLLESPEYREVRGWDQVRFSPGGGMQGTVELVLFNPNPVPLSVAEVEVALSVRGKQVGTMGLPQSTVLPARSETAVRLSVSTAPGGLGNVLKDGLLAFMTGEELPVRAVGVVTAKALGFSRQVPVDVTTNIPLR
jgi:LEA14-like dessication related protein